MGPLFQLCEEEARLNLLGLMVVGVSRMTLAEKFHLSQKLPLVSLLLNSPQNIVQTVKCLVTSISHQLKIFINIVKRHFSISFHLCSAATLAEAVTEQSYKIIEFHISHLKSPPPPMIRSLRASPPYWITPPPPSYRAERPIQWKSFGV